MDNINKMLDMITKSCNNIYIVKFDINTSNINIYCYIFFNNNKINIKIITNFECHCYIDINSDIDINYINYINKFNISSLVKLFPYCIFSSNDLLNNLLF